jgi:PAS domain-containing protein
MSGSRRRHHRRRTGSTARRYRPSELVQVERRRSRMGASEWAGGSGIVLVSILLIVLIWMFANRSVQDLRADVRDRAEQTLSSQATLLAEQVRQELMLIDQSLTVLQEEWKQDSEHFSLEAIQKRLPALTLVSEDLFIADDKRVIRQDIIPAAVGQGIGAAYVTFPHGSLENFDSDGIRNREGRLVIGQTSTPIEGREFLMYVVRPLDHPEHWLIGASYRSDQLPKLYAHANLGFNGVAMLVDARRGVLQGIIGPSARRPRTDLSHSAMLEAAGRSEAGTWRGITPTDEVDRLIAFHRVPGREIIAIVGMPWSQVMAPADGLAEGYRSWATIGTVIVLTVAALVLWSLYTWRRTTRRRRQFERNQADLDSAMVELGSVRTQAAVAGGQLRTLLEGLGDGVAFLDAELCLATWNAAFMAAVRLTPDALRVGLPLDELLRRQAAAGIFGDLANPEEEVASRVAAIRTQRDQAHLMQLDPAGQPVALQLRSMKDGGLMLVVGGSEHWPVAPAPAAVAPAATTELVEDDTAGPASSAPAVEW